MSTTRALALAALLACRAAGPAPAPAIRNLPVAPEPAAPIADGCADAIAGDWTARVWREDALKWDQVLLTIARTGPDTLDGAIVVTTWDGDGDQTEPPRCPDGSPAVSVVVQRAHGSIHDLDVELVGREPVRAGLPCGAPQRGTYQPDHFRGTLDPARSRLHATNDDGSIDIGRVHEFARTACGPAAR